MEFVGPILFLLYILIAFLPVIGMFTISFFLGIQNKKKGAKRIIYALIASFLLTVIITYVILPIYLSLICPFMHLPGIQCGGPTNIFEGRVFSLISVFLLNFVVMYFGVLITYLFKIIKHGK